MWLICGILFTLNVLNLENKKLNPPPPPRKKNNNKKNSMISFENTLLLNMMDYEQIKSYA